MTEPGHLNSFPINQTSTNFLYKIRAHYKMTEPVVFKFIANQPNINQFSLQNQGPLQNQRTGPLKYTQKSLTNNLLQNQYSAKIIFKWPSENLLYKIKDLLSCYQSASKTSTFWTLKTDPSPPDFVEETGGGMQNVQENTWKSVETFNMSNLTPPFRRPSCLW